MDILKSLPRFDWDDYEALLTKRGYKVKIQCDKENVVRGYSIKKGNSSYKSSELGTGRNLMPTKIEDTWKKLHEINFDFRPSKDASFHTPASFFPFEYSEEKILTRRRRFQSRNRWRSWSQEVSSSTTRSWLRNTFPI